MNNLKIKQVIQIRDALSKFNPEKDNKFKSVNDLAVVMEKTLGFKVTASNVMRVFREFDLNKHDYIKAGGHNSLVTQISMIRGKLEEMDARLNELEEALVTKS